jgi:hypothetical protein
MRDKETCIAQAALHWSLVPLSLVRMHENEGDALDLDMLFDCAREVFPEQAELPDGFLRIAEGT